MTNLKLSPCPNCKGPCETRNGTREPDSVRWLWPPRVICMRCIYVMTAPTIDRAIKSHERLAGVCEWRHLLHDSKRDVVGYLTGCGNQFMVCHEDSKDLKHCPDCGKKVKVKG